MILFRLPGSHTLGGWLESYLYHSCLLTSHRKNNPNYVYLGDVVLKDSDNTNLLGVSIDKYHNWNKQIESQPI